MDKMKLQNDEFDAADGFAKQLVRLFKTSVVDDDYPEVRHGYESALRNLIDALIANGTIPNVAAPQPVEAEGREGVWGRFASWLLDHCEGMIISEEMLQQQLDVMLATSSKQDPAEAEELRSCAICGLTVDISKGHTKPTIDFGMAGRSKPKTPPPEQPAIDLEQFREPVTVYRDNWRAYAGTMASAGQYTIAPEKVKEADRLLAIIDGAKGERAEGEP